MSNYELCKKFIEWNVEGYFKDYNFKQYANISKNKWDKFDEFMNKLYGHTWVWGIKECKDYINKCKIDYIKEKING